MRRVKKTRSINLDINSSMDHSTVNPHEIHSKRVRFKLKERNI